MKALTNSQLMKYSNAVSVFKRVEEYNANIAAQRLAGDLSPSYYEFLNSDEQAQYTLGRFILFQNDPAYANYVPVEKI